MTEKALFINDIAQLRKAGSFDRVYYGAEFCQNLIPGLEETKRVMEKTERAGKQFTYVTPFVTEANLRKVNGILRYINRHKPGCEVVFNEWGVFRLIRGNYGNITPVMGRLLAKQQKDTSIYNSFFNEDREKSAYRRGHDGLCVYRQKKIPGSIKRYWMSTAADFELTQDYLLSNGVGRIEVDNLVQGMTVKVPDRFGVSMHFPYGCISTTRLCGLLNLTYSKCKKECLKYYVRMKNRGAPPVVIFGNTVFYESKMPARKDLEKNHIDRIIFAAGR
jgi:hypothetical protein